MRALALLLAVALALALALPGGARAQEDDQGFLTRLLQDNLSGIGREVRITGFAGALSSRATIRELTIADSEGVWLTIRGAALSWNRAALLRGRIEVAELAAEEIELARLPVAEAEPGLPDAAAQPFRLPELPVSVEIGTVQAEKATLGAPVLGEEVVVTLAGGLTLAGGEGTATLAIERSDGREGTLDLSGSFVNATEFLTLDLSLAEEPGGIAATLLALPGRPALALAVAGSGPLSDFAAEVALSSEGEDRLSGSVEIADDAAGGRVFALDLGGDIAPLLVPEYRAFFGSDVRLVARGARREDGSTELSALSIAAAALALDGRMTLAPDGLPEAFSLTGRIAAPVGDGPVRLPSGGDPVLVDGAELALSFDAAAGEEWDGSISVSGLRFGGNRIGQLTLDGDGSIARDGPAGAAERSVLADLAFRATGIELSDAAMAQAVGPRLAGSAAVVWREGAPLSVSRLVVEGDTARLVAQGSFGALAEGVPVSLRGSADVASLAPFSGVAGRPLGGRIVLAFNGVSALLDGRFDIRAGGVARDLSAGIDTLDRVIAGESRLGLDARRDEIGITLRRFDITTPQARIEASGLLRAGATDISASARLDEVGRILPGLAGPAQVRAHAVETAPGAFALGLTGQGPGEAVVAFDGTLTEDAAGALAADGTITARVARLAAWAALAGRPIRGAVTAELTGSAALSENRFDLALEARGEGLGTGLSELDRLLGGTATISAAARREGETTTLSRLALNTRELTAEAAGTLGRATGRIDGSARLSDLGLFVPDFPGPVSAQGTLSRREDRRWGLDIDATGPGGTAGAVRGTLAEGGQSATLTLRGEAPLGLANPAIRPRALEGRASFDLALDGPLGLGALSGRVSTDGARLVAPTLGLALEGIAGQAVLGGGRAQLDLSGGLQGGGRVSLSGPVGLTGGNEAALRIGLAALRLRDPLLYETVVDGEVTVTGPLAGGARVAGTIDLGRTELRIAETGLGTGGDLPGLTHRNEPAAVRATRARAGMLDSGAGRGPGGEGARPYPLDLVIRAPNEIFIRGRGLDAELGGSLRLGGTTASVIPQGQFDLIRGRLDILGRRLALDEGLARLEGAFDPWLRLVASTQAEDITVLVVVEGLASEPEIRFQSAPELPQDEVLARLFFGKGLDQISPLQAAQLASAVATLAGRGGGGIVNRLRENFGLDDLDVTTDADGNAAVRAGRYLSENVYTDVTVGSDGKAEINLNLDVSRSVTVKGRVGSDGESGIGVFFERDF